MPETSIIIRTLNEAKHLGNLLDAISRQSYTDYEIIIVDSGSADGTLEIAKKYPSTVIGIEPRDFTFGYSLNVGCKAAKGKYLVCASAHVFPTTNEWLGHMVSSFKDEKVAMVYGRQVGETRSKFSEQNDFKRFFKNKSVNSLMPLYYANNANSAIRKSLWEKRPFDEYLFGLEDIDFAKAITEKGYSVRYEPNAAVYHIHEEKWAQVFNRYRREAIAAQRIGLTQPPQARLGHHWLFWFLLTDVLISFPNWTPRRLEEILRFRYYQWKGSRQGWFRDGGFDLRKEDFSTYFPPTSKSVVIEGPHRAHVDSVNIPEMTPGDILIKVSYVGICKTDIEVFEGTLGYYRDAVARYPIVPGHEFSGTIAKVGANNKYQERFRVGQKVVGECILSRGEKGERREVGVINHNGAYSEYVVIPGTYVRPIPENLDLKVAALAEPLSVSLRAIRRVEHRLTPKSRILVVGAGTIGNLCAQSLMHRGHQVTVFDKNAERLKFFENKDIPTLSSLDDLSGFSVIVEATGSRGALEEVLKNSAFDSTILLLGFPYGETLYNFEDVVGSEKVIVGSVGAESQDFNAAIAMLPALDTKPFTQKVLPLEEYESAWQLHGTSQFLKIMLTP